MPGCRQLSHPFRVVFGSLQPTFRVLEPAPVATAGQPLAEVRPVPRRDGSRLHVGHNGDKIVSLALSPVRAIRVLNFDANAGLTVRLLFRQPGRNDEAIPRHLTMIRRVRSNKCAIHAAHWAPASVLKCA